MLKNEYIRLRAVEPEDIDFLYRWENNPQLWDVGNTRQPYSLFQLKQYIENYDQNIYETHQLRLMIENLETNETVGTVDLFDFDMHHSRIALGLFIAPEYQGKKYAFQSLKLVEEYVFNFLKLNQLYCEISKKNHASRSLFEKEGYETNGMLKNWIKTVNGFESIIVFQRFKEHYICQKQDID